MEWPKFEVAKTYAEFWADVIVLTSLQPTFWIALVGPIMVNSILDSYKSYLTENDPKYNMYFSADHERLNDFIIHKYTLSASSIALLLLWLSVGHKFWSTELKPFVIIAGFITMGLLLFLYKWLLSFDNIDRVISAHDARLRKLNFRTPITWLRFYVMFISFVISVGLVMAQKSIQKTSTNKGSIGSQTQSDSQRR